MSNDGLSHDVETAAREPRPAVHRGTRLAPGPHCRARLGFRRWTLRSPVDDSELSLDNELLEVVARFSGGRRVGEVMAEFDVAADGEGDPEAEAFLETVAELCDHGVLAEVEVVEGDDVGRLLFAEQEHPAQDFLARSFGSAHTVSLEELGIHRCLRPLGGGELADATYYRYLLASFAGRLNDEAEGPAIAEATIREHRRKLEGLERRWRGGDAGGATVDRALPVCVRPDGRYLLLNGAVSAAMSLELGAPLPVQLLRWGDFLRELVRAPRARWGTGVFSGRPYQSLFYRGECLVAGRRPDLYERLKRVRPEDLEGKRVLDLGANVGMSCQVACELGAASATGVEAEGELVTLAARLNAFYAAPCRFVAHDLDQGAPELPPHDTVFCFAVLGYLRSAAVVESILERTGARVLYLESHREGQDQGDLEGLLEDRELFASVEPLGTTRGLFNDPKPSRRLFRCQLRRG